MIDPLLANVPPNDMDTEEAILSALLINNSGFERVETLTPDDFYKGSHKKIFGAMLSLVSKKEPVDLVTLKQELEITGDLDSVGGPSYLMHISDNAPVATNIWKYAKTVMDLAKARELIQIAQGIVENGFQVKDIEDYISKSQAGILSVQTSTSKDKFCNMEDLMVDAIDRIEKAQVAEFETGLNLGMPKLNNYMQVWGSKLILLAGRPGMGKTSLALSIAMHLGYQQEPVGILSIEMDKEQYADKMLSAEADINSMRFYSQNALHQQENSDLNMAAENISSLPITINDSESNLEDIKRRCRKFKKMGKKLIIIDQLSQIEFEKGTTPYIGYSKNCTAIKQLTKELRIPILLLCQLNRNVETRGDKRPTKSDLAETGRLEQDADLILFVHREGMYDRNVCKSQTQIILDKNRQGATGIENSVIFKTRRGMFQMSL
jgi:replicative DNA helicase